MRSKPEGDSLAYGIKHSFLAVKDLVDIRRRSLRRGIWFKTLRRAERGLIELSIRCVDEVRSPLLAKVLTTVIEKLTLALKFLLRIERIGLPIAEKFSLIAYSWGNRDALMWRYDLAYVRLLGLNAMNSQSFPYYWG